MKTLFQMGMPGTFSFWSRQMPRPFMGQATPSGDLTEDQRNAVVAKLKDVIARGLEVDNWIHSVGDQQAAILGNDYQAFRGFVDRAATLAEVAYPIYQRLQSDNQEDWWIQEADAPSVDGLGDMVDGAYRIYVARVKNAPAKQAIPTALPKIPGITTAPSSKTAAVPTAPNKGILPPQGPSTNDLLLGGALAVGVGVVLYALL